jgi:DNA-binding CsgD family transcriptional regulator
MLLPESSAVTMDARSKLTLCQQRIVGMVAEAKNTEEISAELGISQHAVKGHLMKVYKTLADEGVKTRLQLLLWALGRFKGQGDIR